MATALKRGRTWTAYYEVGRTPEARRKKGTKGGFKTKKEAEQHAQEQERAIREGRYAAPGKLTVGTYMGQWLADYAESRLRPKTAQSYAGVVARYITPNLGHIALTELRPAHVEAFYGALQRRGLAPATNRQTHVILKSALKRAVRLGLLAVNPCGAVDAPRLKRPEMPSVTAGQAQELVQAAGDGALGTLFKVLLYTGLRRSEGLALTWEDIDLAAGTLSVRRSLHHVKGQGTVIEPPKSSKSRRQVDLSASTVAFLKAWRIAQTEQRLRIGPLWQGEGWVFTNETGGHLEPDTVTHAFGKLAKKLGLAISLHGLRHAHASLLLQQGVPLKIVSERLGHSTIAITGDVYSHVTPGLGKTAAQEFDRAMLAPAVTNG